MLKLQLIDNPEQNVKLSLLPVSIGGDEGNNLVLNGASISDFHAEIHKDEQGLYIIDLLSGGGTFVNEHRVSNKHRLNPWDVVRLGSVKLEINDPNVCKPGLWALRSESDLLARQFYTLNDKTIVGRDSDCDLTIDSHLLSRRHAEIHVEGDFLRVVDLNSRNGTYLNGKKITEAMVKPQDELRFDQQTFIVVGPNRVVDHADQDDDLTGFRDRITTNTLVQAALNANASTRAMSLTDMPDISVGPRAYLVFTSGDELGKRYALVKEKVTIGRSLENDFVISDPEASKRHATLRLVEEHWHLKDNNSSNGIAVNGIVDSAFFLRSGDKVRIGSTELLFEFEKDAYHDDDTVLC